MRFPENTFKSCSTRKIFFSIERYFIDLQENFAKVFNCVQANPRLHDLNIGHIVCEAQLFVPLSEISVSCVLSFIMLIKMKRAILI